MKLRITSKVVLTLMGVFVVYILLISLIGRFVFFPMLLQVEQSLAMQDVNRVVSALDRETRGLGQFTRDYATWDDSWNFMRPKSPRQRDLFIRSNLTPHQFEMNRLDLVYYIAPDGRVVWHKIDNAALETKTFLAKFPTTEWPEKHPLLGAGSPGTPSYRFEITDVGLVILAASPILTSKGEGPSRGTLVVGRTMDEKQMEELYDRTNVKFKIVAADKLTRPKDTVPLDAPMSILSPEATEVSEKALGLPHPSQRPPPTASHFRYYTDPQQRFMIIQARLENLYGFDNVGIEVLRPRFLFVAIMVNSFLGIISFVVAGLIMIGALLLALNHTVLRPLRELTRTITAVESRQRLNLRLPVKSGDEMGDLAREFNGMLDRLESDRLRREKAEEAMKKSEERFRNLAIHDDLTGLYNTRHLYARLERLMTDFHNERKPFSLIFMDIDRFKSVVDTHGHLNGSQAIKEVAETILSCIEPPSFGVSYGGDEYVIVLPGATRASAMAKAEEIRSRMNETVYLHSRGLEVRLTASLGVANCPEDADNMETLMALADSQLFYIKSRGKNAVG
ncbi:MAG: diguanylate cyclase [Verrucomicrobiae bacterium]|nr:diguanylate cyclase [Verrucomicrobiae bacterium]